MKSSTHRALLSPETQRTTDTLRAAAQGKSPVLGRRAEFKVKALMGETVIGDGSHQRAVIEVKYFKDRVSLSQA